MTGFTTRGSFRFFAVLVGLSLLVHLVLAVTMRPFATTTMAFDAEAEEQRALEVERREAERKEQQRLERENTPLNEERAEQLRREEERRKADELRQETKRLLETVDELEELQQEKLRELEQRKPQAVKKSELKRVQQAAKELAAKLRSAGRTDDEKQLKPVEEAEQIVDEVRDLAKQDEVAPEAVAELAEKTAEITEKLEQTADSLEGHPVEQNRFKTAAGGAETLTEALNDVASPGEMQKMNDTSSAADPEQLAQERGLDEQSVQSADAEKLYESSRTMEKQAQQLAGDIRAVELAQKQGISFEEARKQIGSYLPPRPELGALAAQGQTTVGGLNDFRQALQEAATQITDMRQRAQSTLAQTQGGAGVTALSSRRGAANHPGSGMVAGQELGRRDESDEGSNMQRSEVRQMRRALAGDLIRRSLPGRMFTEGSERAGWLFIDTWYVIGPWENKGTINYANIHPPEYEIDFDAVYTDGKFADKPDHEYHKLRWEFMQSESMRIEPPLVVGAATYYFYSEVYFDRPRTMMVAIATDDASRVWINGELVVEEESQSSWRLDEDIKRVEFKAGFNPILVRLEQGPARACLSMLMCPPEAAEAAK